MEADKMFEALGYAKAVENYNKVVFQKEPKGKQITLDLREHTVKSELIFSGAQELTVEEMNASIKKFEEIKIAQEKEDKEIESAEEKLVVCPWCKCKPRILIDCFGSGKKTFRASCQAFACPTNPETNGCPSIEKAVKLWNACSNV